jgi:hypothetical protein
VLRIRIRIGWIRAGKNDPQREKKEIEMHCFEVLGVLF